MHTSTRVGKTLRSQFKLGDRVLVRAKLVRTFEHNNVSWKPLRIAPIEGIVVGARVRTNGRMEVENAAPEEYAFGINRTTRFYQPNFGFDTLLVATEMGRTHLIVAYSDIVRL